MDVERHSRLLRVALYMAVSELACSECKPSCELESGITEGALSPEKK